MINILTLKYGDKYGPEYVNRLYRGLLRNSTVDFNFICYTDCGSELDNGIEIREIEDGYVEKYNGHWLKLMFHKRGFVEPGSICIIVDIDWVITGNIDSILTYPLEHNTINAVYRWWSYTKETTPMNSGFLMFYNGETDHLWQKYDQSPPYYWRDYYYNNGIVSMYGLGEQNFVIDHVNLPINFIKPYNAFMRYTCDKGIQDMINDCWTDISDDLILADGELSEEVKMVHFTSNFDFKSNDNHIGDHEWILKHWR